MDVTSFAEEAVNQFANTPLPEIAVRLFALALPFAEVVVGLLLIAGLFTRWTLVFGTSLRSDFETLTQQT